MRACEIHEDVNDSVAAAQGRPLGGDWEDALEARRKAGAMAEVYDRALEAARSGVVHEAYGKVRDRGGDHA